MVTSSTGKISSRTGNIILYRELVQEALEQASHIIEDKSPGLNAMQKAEISRVVALGALKFNMLNKDNNKVIVFDWDEALNFEGQAAPYIQYAHARACRILEKAGYIPDGSFDFSHLAAGHAVGEVALSGDTSGDSQQGQAVEVTLVDLISRYPDEVARAADQYKPVILTAYLYELAEAFNNFYHDCPVLKAETKALRQARLGLTFAAKQTIRNGLNLLGIEAPEYM
jgi:arginyl-tRNA synthetase